MTAEDAFWHASTNTPIMDVPPYRTEWVDYPRTVRVVFDDGVHLLAAAMWTGVNGPPRAYINGRNDDEFYTWAKNEAAKHRPDGAGE